MYLDEVLPFLILLSFGSPTSYSQLESQLTMPCWLSATLTFLEPLPTVAIGPETQPGVTWGLFSTLPGMAGTWQHSTWGQLQPIILPSVYFMCLQRHLGDVGSFWVGGGGCMVSRQRPKHSFTVQSLGNVLRTWLSAATPGMFLGLDQIHIWETDLERPSSSFRSKWFH